MTDVQEKRVLEELWLHYYNDTLLAQGLISEEEHNRMRLRIKQRSSSDKSEKSRR